jgi:hypothetical protein
MYISAPVVEVIDNVPANQESPGTESREEYGIKARALYDYQAGKSLIAKLKNESKLTKIIGR